MINFYELFNSIFINDFMFTFGIFIISLGIIFIIFFLVLGIIFDFLDGFFDFSIRNTIFIIIIFVLITTTIATITIEESTGNVDINTANDVFNELYSTSENKSEEKNEEIEKAIKFIKGNEIQIKVNNKKKGEKND